MNLRAMHMTHQVGLPTVLLEPDFVQASQLGDMLEAQRRVLRLDSSPGDLAK